MKHLFVASSTCGRRSVTHRAVQIVVFSLLLFVATTASRAQGVEIFIKFTPPPGSPTPVVAGESADPVYPGSTGWFEVKDFSFSIVNSNSIGSASGGAGAGRAKFAEANLSKMLNLNSPALFRALTTGTHYDSAQMVVRSPGSPQNQAGIIFDFKFVFLTTQNFSGSQGSEGVSEQLKIAYGGIRVTNRPLNANGTAYGTSVIGQWNQVSNNDDIDTF